MRIRKIGVCIIISCLLTMCGFSVEVADLLEMKKLAQMNIFAQVESLYYAGEYYLLMEFPNGDRRTTYLGDKIIFDEDIIADEQVVKFEIFIKDKKIRLDSVITSASLTLKSGEKVENKFIIPKTRKVYLGDKVLYREIGPMNMSAIYPKGEFFNYPTISIIPGGILYKIGYYDGQSVSGMTAKNFSNGTLEEKDGKIFISYVSNFPQFPDLSTIVKDTLDGKTNLPVNSEIYRLNNPRNLVSRKKIVWDKIDDIWLPVNNECEEYGYLPDGNLRFKSTLKMSVDKSSVKINQKIEDDIFSFRGLGTEVNEKIVDYTFETPVEYSYRKQ